MFEIITEEDYIKAKNTLSTITKVGYICYRCNNHFEKQLRACKSFPLVCNACSRQTDIPFSDNPIKVDSLEAFNNLKGKVHTHQMITYKCDICEKETTKPYHTITKLKCRQHSTKSTLLEKYGVESIFNRPDIRANTISAVKDTSVSEKRKKTCLEKYGVDNIHKLEATKEAIKQTCLEKYGVENPAQCQTIKNKMQQTCLEKYGVRSYSQTEDFMKKSYKKFIYDNESFDSAWELYFWIYCKDNNKNISRNTTSFEYTYNGELHKYYPDFIVDNKYYEIKGDQFFKDDGTMQNPFDHSLDGLYEAKHQCGLKNNVIFLREDNMNQIITFVDNKYTKDFVSLFNISLPFPYLNEDLRDTTDMGLIHHFHKSIYDATRKGKPAPTVAWQDKNIIKKVALNRLKYKGHCRPSDILQGFNVTRIANKISVFKPKLAEELIKKYLYDADIIIDPFSGFSGRLLGAFNCGKHYIGCDINEDHIRESNEIVQYKKMGDMCDIKVQDLITCEEKDWSALRNVCLFTCPPYGGKEHWNKNNDEIEKSCDEWIDLCLEKHKGCKKYLFVVDETEKYKDKIIDSIQNSSHFGSNTEYVILL